MDENMKKARVTYSKAVGVAIRFLRKKMFKQSQERFGEDCGVSQKTVSNWERNEDFKNFSLKGLFNLSWNVGVYPSDILRYVEAYLDEKYPGEYEGFKKRKEFTEMAAERWLKDDGYKACTLFEMLRRILAILSEKDPVEITDEDLMYLRMILKKIA